MLVLIMLLPETVPCLSSRANSIFAVCATLGFQCFRRPAHVNLANTTVVLLHLPGCCPDALRMSCMVCSPNTPPLHCLDPDRRERPTLALEVAKTADSVYLDLESHADRARLTDAELYLSDHERTAGGPGRGTPCA